MNRNFEFTGTWQIEGALHVGTGLSESRADRAMRLVERIGPVGPMQVPVIPGEAVKGALRGSAERLVRWLTGDRREEADNHSLPRHPALQRIFRGDAVSGGPLVRFYAAEFTAGGQERERSSTKICPHSGTAEKNTLRTMQEWAGGARFRLLVRGWGADWHVQKSTAWWDLGLLIAAAVNLDGIGGKKGSGLGAVRLVDLQLKEGEVPRLDKDWIEGMKEQLREQSEGESNG